MRVLIVEDEQIAADRLIRLISEIDKSIEIVEHLDSVKSTISWFGKNDEPDLLFLDIQLADGLSFEIFEEHKIKCPIIFTTAYSEYAIKAFKVNSIDYLLKPISSEDLTGAIDKYKAQNLTGNVDTTVLIDMLQQSNSFKERFIIKVGEHLKSVLTSDTEIFYSFEKATFLMSKSGQRFIIDFTLDQLEGMVDPKMFFRVNRKQIIHIDGISDIITYSTSRLRLKLNIYNEEEIIVARDRVGDFKSWLDR